MFWTAFIWGLGASCGAAVGLMGFMVGVYCLEKFSGKISRADAMVQVNVDSLAALQERNELTQQTNRVLQRIAGTLERTADKP